MRPIGTRLLKLKRARHSIIPLLYALHTLPYISSDSDVPLVPPTCAMGNLSTAINITKKDNFGPCTYDLLHMPPNWTDSPLSLHDSNVSANVGIIVPNSIFGVAMKVSETMS